MNIIKIDTCGSTNLQLKELADQQSLEEGTVIVCRAQTAGRGQKGNCWEAEAGKNLTFSILFYPQFLSLKNHFLLSECIALGIKSVLDTYCDHISIKWPNDIYYGDRKIAGILIENEITGNIITQSIAGIGVNVNQEVFYSDAHYPVSLKQITGRETCLSALLETMITNILSWYKRLQKNEIDALVHAYHRALYRNSGFFSYKDRSGIFLASIESVSNDGLIHLISEEGEKRSYTFKEVSFV